MKKIFALTTFACTAFLSFSCSTTAMNPGSSTRQSASESSSSDSSPESYKLPITRSGQKTTRVAYNFWSGEWPQPVIDVKSDQTGTTTISAFSTLRNPSDSEKVSCTIKNGLYHPWSESDPSLENYYTLTNVVEYKALNSIKYEVYNSKTKKLEFRRIPKNSIFTNIIYYAENQCGAILKIGKSSRHFENSCDFFYENKDLELVSKGAEFNEQWLYLKCEEKNAEGKNIKVFVQDSDLLNQPGIQRGCPAEYGSVQGAKKCDNN